MNTIETDALKYSQPAAHGHKIPVSKLNFEYHYTFNCFLKIDASEIIHGK